MNFEKYPWLNDLTSAEARASMEAARTKFQINGAVTFPDFLATQALADCVNDATGRENTAFTTDDTHTAYLKPPDTTRFSANSVYNHQMRTQVASTAFDELPKGSVLNTLYQSPILLELVSSIVQKKLFLSDDPLGCCSINVFRPGYHHSFHFDESEFSTTLMIQEAEDWSSGLFQYTSPLRGSLEDLVLSSVASALHAYDIESLGDTHLAEWQETAALPTLHTLNFRPGTLSIFSGSKSLHRVTRVCGQKSRLVAVLTFASEPGFRNSAAVQKLFWGRAVPGNVEASASPEESALCEEASRCPNEKMNELEVR